MAVSKEFKETQKLVKDAAKSMKLAAERAAKVARKTGTQISKSKEVGQARREGLKALKLMAAAAKIAFDAATDGAKTVGNMKELKKAGRKTKAAAQSSIKATRKASTTIAKDAANRVKSGASKAAAEAKKKVS